MDLERIRIRDTVRSGSVLNSRNNRVSGVKMRMPIKLISVPLNCLEAIAAILVYVLLQTDRAEAQPIRRKVSSAHNSI